jgi:hypothetical protein
MIRGSYRFKILGIIVCLALTTMMFWGTYSPATSINVSAPMSRGQGPGNANWTFVSNFTLGMYSGIDVWLDANPDFGDLDNDGDLDMVVGNNNGTLWFYNNTGTTSNPMWGTPYRMNISGIDISIGSSCSPALVDIDADGDLDMIVGEGFGDLYFYNNTGTKNKHKWVSPITYLDEDGNSMFKGGYATPTFADMDNDGDYDLTLGEWFGGIYHYENNGTASKAAWKENKTMFSGVKFWDTSSYTAPEMGDLDNDNDYDLIVVDDWGWVFYYENTGTTSSASWTNRTIEFSGVKVDEWGDPALGDLDGDGDLDLTIGDYNGTLIHYEYGADLSNLLNVFLTLENGDAPSAKGCYARYKEYSFKVTALSGRGDSDIEYVNLTLDENGESILLSWDNSSRTFNEITDPNNYVELLSVPGDATNDTAFTWTLYFKLKFNWNYPDEDLHTAQAYSKGYSKLMGWHNRTNFYQVENDLQFNGTLAVTGAVQGPLNSGDTVKMGEQITWTDLKVVYDNSVYSPPDDEFDVAVWDDDGDSWADMVSSGENFTIVSTADMANDISDIHTINITGIPAANDNTSETFEIIVDASNVTFADPTPVGWQITLTPTCGINITDVGGGLVDAATIDYATSTDNGTAWSAWTTAGEITDATSITPSVTATFVEGIDNLIKWRASDAVGNGANVSEDYRVPRPGGRHRPGVHQPHTQRDHHGNGDRGGCEHHGNGSAQRCGRPNHRICILCGRQEHLDLLEPRWKDGPRR